MFRIELYESPIGPDQNPQFVKSLGEKGERTDAIAYIEGYIARYGHNNYDGKQDRWWCRNDGDETVQMLVIRGV